MIWAVALVKSLENAGLGKKLQFTGWILMWFLGIEYQVTQNLKKERAENVITARCNLERLVFQGLIELTSICVYPENLIHHLKSPPD